MSRSPGAIGVPIVITGFEPLDLLEGVLSRVRQLEAGRAGGREPVRAGRPPRGQSGRPQVGRGGVRGLRPQMAGHRHDPAERAAAARRVCATTTPSEIRSSWKTSRPRNRRLHQRADPQGAQEAARLPGVRQDVYAGAPLGATMVSSEGACAAYYAYGRHLEAEAVHA